MTPENSEQPRETRDGMPLVERFDRHGAVMYGGKASGSMNMSGVVPAQGHSKVSSPELASLAAKYLDFTINDPAFAQTQADVRALAASVLAQAEGNPRK